MKTMLDRFLALLLLSPVSTVAAASEPTVIGAEQRAFYGIPFDLTYGKIGCLKLKYTKGSEMAEGARLRTVTFSVDATVQITAVFDRRGQVAELRTSSPAARDPHGIRVGSSLTDVQKAWPTGKLYYGRGESGPYAIYFTGTNVGLRMSDVPSGDDPQDRRVREIVAMPFQLKL